MFVRRILVCAICSLMLAFLSGCAISKWYNVDYGDAKVLFEGAEDSYRAGDAVQLTFSAVATDTNYGFAVEGAEASIDVEDGGYVIRFIMPENDVKVTFSSRNSMVDYLPMNKYEMAGIRPGDMLVDYYYRVKGTDDEQGYLEVTLTYESPDQVDLSVYEGVAGAMEERTSYTVPLEAADKCLEAIADAQMATWGDEEDATSLDGSIVVVRFFDVDSGRWIRVSSEHMPEDGLRLMTAVHDIMREYIPE